MLAVAHHFLWIRGVSITIGLYEHSRVMLEGAQHVWTQSAVGDCISITSLSSLNSWIEIIGIPTVILVWYSESKINRSGNITNRPCQYMLESHLNANRTLLPTGVNYKWTKVDVLRVHITSWCCDHGIQITNPAYMQFSDHVRKMSFSPEPVLDKSGSIFEHLTGTSMRFLWTCNMG